MLRHHRLQVLATDRDGQSTLSAPSELLIAGEAPSVKIKRTAAALGGAREGQRPL